MISAYKTMAAAMMLATAAFCCVAQEKGAAQGAPGKHYVLPANAETTQWGWLDPDGKEGLMNKVIYEIDPATPCVSCPYPQLS